MADNTTLNVGSGGDVIATDELTTLNGGAVTGVKVQRVKVGFGADGSQNDVSANSPLPTGSTYLISSQTFTEVPTGVYSRTVSVPAGAQWMLLAVDVSHNGNMTVGPFDYIGVYADSLLTNGFEGYVGTTTGIRKFNSGFFAQATDIGPTYYVWFDISGSSIFIDGETTSPNIDYAVLFYTEAPAWVRAASNATKHKNASGILVDTGTANPLPVDSYVNSRMDNQLEAMNFLLSGILDKLPTADNNERMRVSLDTSNQAYANLTINAIGNGATGATNHLWHTPNFLSNMGATHLYNQLIVS